MRSTDTDSPQSNAAPTSLRGWPGRSRRRLLEEDAKPQRPWTHVPRQTPAPSWHSWPSSKRSQGPRHRRWVMQAEGEFVQLHEVAGGPRDFRTLYEDEHRRLFQTLYFVTGDRHDAADLMHEAFLKIWERWDSIG